MAKKAAVQQKVVQSHKEKTDGALYGRRRFLFLLQIISFS